MSFRHAPRIAILVLLLTLASAVPAFAGTHYRARVFDLVNDARRNHGLTRVGQDGSVNWIARRHSKAMVNAGYLFHTANLQRKLSADNPTMWGEIIAMKGTVRSTVRAWLRSAPHRHIMLTAGFRRAGVGVIKARGMLWVTMIFYR